MNEDTADISKSERKRQAQRLQQLGRELAELKPALLQELELPPRLLDALADYQRFPSFEAKRRQLQFVGKLMRDVDLEPIQEVLDRQRGASAEGRYEFHQLELWRDRLLKDPEALTDYLRKHPHADRQRLRQVLQRARKNQDEMQHKAAARALFRLLREFG